MYIVFILHIFQDADVPIESSQLLMERLATEDVDLIIRKTGDHRLNSPDDHKLLLSEVDRFLKQYPIDQQTSKL